MTEKEFIDAIKKVKGPRVHKLSNSYGTYDAYKYYNHNKPKDPKFRLKEVQYFKVIRLINNYLREDLCKGLDIKFPSFMGVVEVRKSIPTYKKIDGKIQPTLAIDWDSTLKYWYEDKKALQDKVLIRKIEKEIFRVYYNKRTAKYKNKSFFQFFPNRELKLRLKYAIKYNNFDAFNRI